LLAKRNLYRYTEDAAAARAAAAQAAAQAASLAAPGRVRGQGAGMAVDAVMAGRAALFASADSVLDQLAAQEAHAVALGEAAAKAGLKRSAIERVDRERRNRVNGLQKRIVDKGFLEKWADEALRHCPEVESDFLEQVQVQQQQPGEPPPPPHHPSKAAQRAAVMARLGAAMDWLCIHVPKEDMPDAFLKLSEAQLAPVPNSAAAAAAAAAVGGYHLLTIVHFCWLHLSWFEASLLQLKRPR
jgi:hypothetical protein